MQPVPTHFRPVFLNQWAPMILAVLSEIWRHSATLKEDQGNLVLGSEIMFEEWSQNKQNICFPLKSLLRIKLELSCDKLSYRASGTECPEDERSSPYHLNVNFDPKHKFGARYSTVFVVCCKCQFARECVGLWHKSKKHRALSSTAFAFAWKRNNYSICFASKMWIANVFLTSLRGKNHTQYG